MPSTYLVTGGAGFIGSHTAEALLLRGDSVIVVDEINDYYSINQKQHNLDALCAAALRSKSAFKFYQGSCQDESFMANIFEAEHIDIVCHLAARAGVRPSIRANVTATVNLLELSRQHNISNFVYASSSSVYGKNTKVPFAETDRTDYPVSPYAATKKTCELMATTYNHMYGLPTTGLRFFTVYGPRGRPDMAPFLFVDKISRGIPIDKFGDGTSCRDYTFITDIVSGILAALDRPSQKAAIYNLGNSATVSLNDFIHVIEETVGKKAVIHSLPDQLGDVFRTYADLTLSERELGYQPTTDIRAGMRLFVDWYQTAYRKTQEMDALQTTQTEHDSRLEKRQLSFKPSVGVNLAFCGMEQQRLKMRLIDNDGSVHGNGTSNESVPLFLESIVSSRCMMQSPSPPPSDCMALDYAISIQDG
ncbi:hypothetical protein BDV3_004918 [Batrachochytrium dendrobatidis]